MHRGAPRDLRGRRAFVALALCLILPVGCARRSDRADGSGSEGAARDSDSVRTAFEAAPPLFGNLGTHHRKITTSSSEAQQYFDQGLILAFSFNHDEAIRSFHQAAALDPDCAMAWWGIAYANGPHINNPSMTPEQSAAAWEAVGKARSLARGSSAAERDLIEAVAARYANPAPEDRKPLDQAYAAAMRKIWRAHSKDADIGSLFAESLMDVQPWDLWTEDGKPKLATPEILTVLDRVLALDPDHPMANHLFIHAVEASPHPERGLRSAERLRYLVPGAGHMVHMPAHIESRVGRWSDAVSANQRAIDADRAYRARSPRQGFYRIYMAHNRHFLSWAAMMEGQSELATRAAREMIANIPEDFVREMAFFADGYMTIPLDALMRFGRWDEILREPKPAAYLPITTAHWHFARGVALAALGRLPEAKAEQQAFLDATAKVTDERIVGNNSARHVLSIAENVLDGEIAFREGNIDRAVASLRSGARLEDELKYNEAPDWIQPVRHALGGVLVSQGRMKEAEAVYREDLRRNPENGWSLWGLRKCLEARGAKAEARQVEARFKKTWSGADVELEASCFCVAGK